MKKYKKRHWIENQKIIIQGIPVNPTLLDDFDCTSHDERDRKSAISLELQKEYGLRVTAATKINAKQLKGNNRFEFVNKGGKQQTITLNPLLYKKLEKSVKNGKDGHFVAYNTYIRYKYKLSGQSHGLRYTFKKSKDVLPTSTVEVAVNEKMDELQNQDQQPQNLQPPVNEFYLFLEKS
jgi:hypothetical protein